MDFYNLPDPRFFLYETNLYPYLTWVFYAALLLLYPLWLKRERNLFTLFLISLPLESALAINAGFFIRPSYVIGLILVLKTSLRGLRFPAKYKILLALFVLIAVAGIFLNLDLLGKATSGESRATFLRPIIQLGQLTTFILITTSVFTLLKRGNYFRQMVRVMHWVSVGVALYAIWEIAAIYFHLPYLNLDSMRPSYWYIGFGGGNGYLFRPHGTFIEPIELNNFQMLGIACSLAYGVLYERRGWRYWGLLFIQLAVLLGALSRSTMVTFALLAPVFLLLYPKAVKSAIGFLLNRGARIAFVVIAIVMIVYGFTTTLEELKQANPVTQVLYSRIVWIRKHKTFGFSAIGRADAPAEIKRLSDDGRLAFGVGIGNEANWWGGVGGTASAYSQILIYTGIFGLFVFLVFISSILYGLFRNYWNRSNDITLRKVSLIFFIGFFGMLMQRLSFSGFLTDTYLWVVFAICIYLGQLGQRKMSVNTLNEL